MIFINRRIAQEKQERYEIVNTILTPYYHFYDKHMDEMCVICQEYETEVRIVRCHCKAEYCFKCIEKWDDLHGICPLCSEPFRYGLYPKFLD
jgi:hypothetical protein